ASRRCCRCPTSRSALRMDCWPTRSTRARSSPCSPLRSSPSRLRSSRSSRRTWSAWGRYSRRADPGGMTTTSAPTSTSSAVQRMLMTRASTCLSGRSGSASRWSVRVPTASSSARMRRARSATAHPRSS
ncbi:MAG: hypothetical protein AVDCRST_MAG88-3006, partial [uncultured Thermomicrobiales bacterium]